MDRAKILARVKAYSGAWDIVVIGGGAVYEEFKQVFNKIYLTEVYADVRGDAYFDYDFDTKEWQLVEERRFEKSGGTTTPALTVADSISRSSSSALFAIVTSRKYSEREYLTLRTWKSAFTRPTQPKQYVHSEHERQSTR